MVLSLDLNLSEEKPTQTTTNNESTPEELVRRYCSAVNIRGGIFVIIGGLMWLLQPMVRKKIDELKLPIKTSQLIFLYKWVGLGILFIGAYATFRLALA